MGFYNKYNVIELVHDYEKVARIKGGQTKEILITNYI